MPERVFGRTQTFAIVNIQPMWLKFGVTYRPLAATKPTRCRLGEGEPRVPVLDQSGRGDALDLHNARKIGTAAALYPIGKCQCKAKSKRAASATVGLHLGA